MKREGRGEEGEKGRRLRGVIMREREEEEEKEGGKQGGEELRHEREGRNRAKKRRKEKKRERRRKELHAHTGAVQTHTAVGICRH